MSDAATSATEHYTIKQRITMGVNRYEISRSGADFVPTELIAFAQQKRMKLKEEVFFYEDDSKQKVLFSFKARNVMDINSVVDVYDEAHQELGTFQKDFGKSLLNSTWYLTVADLPKLTAREASTGKAIARRFGVPLVYNFVFTNEEGVEVATVNRKFGVRDLYKVTVEDTRYDERVVLAMMVALDALQDR
ncbi:hypothetical protein [Demequina sp. NBRC 110056]|uniref:hypothetical protein n=1 Tax=Demequina sp. NBRC 110056 TaxID=1570345 RepID=UPI0009FEC8FF|nr:hypothetical protein [Demequina sp. NBRC 110056]